MRSNTHCMHSVNEAGLSFDIMEYLMAFGDIGVE